MKIVSVGPIPWDYWPVGPLINVTQESWHVSCGKTETQIVYRELVKRMAAHVFDVSRETFLYQIEPNLRIHPPGGVAVPWHTDADFGHLPEEWNVWVPLTEMTHPSQRLHTEDETGFNVWGVPLGSALIFPGARVRHGNANNVTDTTRISFDFRLLAKEHYRDTGAVTVKYGIPLRVPEYWREMDA